MTEQTLTRSTAHHIAWLRQEQPTPDVLAAVKLCLLDFLGCCVRARMAPWTAALNRIATVNGVGESFHMGLGRQVPASVAAFGNGTLGHSLIREDMHVRSGSHIGVLVIPAMLALAERDKLPGSSLIAGIVTGYEIAASLGGAIWGSGRHNRHLRPSGMTGAFGVAAGAAASTGLDVDKTVHALGFAANFACGLNQWAWSGGQEIFIHAGMAAESGLKAHDLARAGLLASEDILEGRDGLFAAFQCGESARDIYAASLNRTQPRAVLGVRHKPVAGCNFIQTPVAAALAAKHRIPADGSVVERVVLYSFDEARRYPGCDYAGPYTSVQQSKMSLQFAVCAALAHEFLDERAYADFHDEEMLRLIAGMEIRIDDTYNAAFPQRQSARVELHLRDGSVITEAFDDVPWLETDAVIARFRRELVETGIPDAIEPLIEAIDRLHDSPDCAELFSAISRTAVKP